MFSRSDDADLESDPEITRVWRLIDASLNRASEGLRVTEDIWRYSYEEPSLARLAKDLRHRLAALANRIDHRLLATARDAQNDIGRETKTAAEANRESLNDLRIANLKRAQQALRTLEESLKIVQRDLAPEAESIRYDTYQLESAGEIYLSASRRLASCRLGVLLDGCGEIAVFQSLISALLDAGVDMIQLRDKQLNDRELMRRGDVLSKRVPQGSAIWIFNDRPDLAALCGADGVHLGQDDLPIAAARRILPPGALVGVSTHSPQQARQATIDGADYIGVGPIFPSATKSFATVCGPELLVQVRSVTQIPQFAIGGINSKNLAAVLAAGGDRIVVGAAVTGSADVARAAGELVKSLAAGIR